MANIVGVKGVKSETIKLSDFQTDFPPGVLVYSAKEAEYKELVLRRDLINVYPQLIQTLGPEGMRSFNKHVFFPKFLQDPSLIDIMFPDTLDELHATEENEMLKQNKYPPVSADGFVTREIMLSLGQFAKNSPKGVVKICFCFLSSKVEVIPTYMFSNGAR